MATRRVKRALAAVICASAIVGTPAIAGHLIVANQGVNDPHVPVFGG